MSADVINRLAAELARLKTPEEIRRFRRRLDKDTAQAVIRALDPLDRGAVLLCLKFASDGWRAPFDSAIIDAAELEPKAAD